MDGHRSEDIEHLTFEDESIDLVVTQDVLEHVWDPRAACREIARVLRPGGLHIFTVPVAVRDASRCRVVRHADGSLEHHLEPTYHGDPYCEDGALVVTDWGQDVGHMIDRWSGVHTSHVRTRSPAGSKDPLVDVFVSRKPRHAEPAAS